MAWSKNYTTNVNGGNEYQTGDHLLKEDLNAIINNVLYIGEQLKVQDYNASTEYKLFNIVRYAENGHAYMYINATASTGTLPTNTTYWRLLVEKGDKGDKGDKGISFRFLGNWDSGTSYVSNADYIDCVYANGGMYGCILDNSNQSPPNETYWSLILNGITSISKTDTTGNIDTYTITYSNGNTTTFTVTNANVANTTNILIGDGAGNAVDSGISASTILNTLSAVTTSGNPVNIQNTNGGFVDKVKITNDTASAISSPLTGKSVGKNQLDIENNYNNNDVVASPGTATNEYIDNILYAYNGESSSRGAGSNFNCQKNTNYIISYYAYDADDDVIPKVVIYDADTNTLGLKYGNGYQSIPFNSGNNTTVYVRYLRGYSGTNLSNPVTFENVMIKQETTATDFEPYTATAFSIPLKDTDNTTLSLAPASEIKLIDGKYYLNDTELHQETQDALRSIPTVKGETNLIGDQPFTFDVSEFQLGLESIDAMLTLPNGKRVNVITKDRMVFISSGEYAGKTLQYILQELKNEIDGKQNTLTFDDTPTSGSSNPVKSGGIYTAIDNMTLGDVADNSIPLIKLKSISVNMGLSPQLFDFMNKTWTGLTDFYGDYIWTDGDNVYCSNGSTQQKVLNVATSTWTNKTWSELTSFSGSNIWTDGENVYYSNGTTQKVLNVATSTWTNKTWTGLTSFYGGNIWTDGDKVYCSEGSTQKELDVTASTWTNKTWTGLTSFSGRNIWTDGDNVYCSNGSTQQVLDVTASTWTNKTWTGLTSFSGYHIWTDGENVYYSNGTTQKVLNVATSTWTNKTWSGLTEFTGRNIWTDGDKVYCSEGSTQKVLVVNKKIHS